MSASQVYQNACGRDQVLAVPEVIQAFEGGNTKELTLSHRKTPLMDIDACCLAEGLTMHHPIRILDLEENKVGAQGLQALVDAFNVNPGFIRELRLGKNDLRDPPIVALGNALTLEGAGLKVVDLSQNGVTKLGAQALSHALSSRACDLVEVSFHCNDLDAEAGLYLAQAIRASTRLKHLHLGYNALRDGGATHLARALPIARSLLTLDLTANRIGSNGGADLVKALLSETTNLQRLNLRHNNFDDDTLALFIQVVEKNTTLQQLFLGYMNPSYETAEAILAALAWQNKTLVCFDCYGWKLHHHAGPVPVVDELLKNNQNIRALLTDHDFQGMDEEGNDYRVSGMGWHEVYVGGDDRLAASAAARHQSRAISQPRSVSGQNTRADSPQQSQPSSARGPAKSSGSQSPQREAPQPTTVATSSNRPSSTAAAKPMTNATADEELDQLVSELDQVPCDPDLRNHLGLIIAQLQLKIEVQRSHHQQQITMLEERVRALERSRQDDNEDVARRAAALVHQQLKKDQQQQQLREQQQQSDAKRSQPRTTSNPVTAPPPASSQSNNNSRNPNVSPSYGSGGDSPQRGSTGAAASRSQPRSAAAGQPTSGSGSGAPRPTPGVGGRTGGQQQGNSNSGSGKPMSEPANRPASPPARSNVGGARNAPQPRNEAPPAATPAPAQPGTPQVVKERQDSQFSQRKPQSQTVESPARGSVQQQQQQPQSRNQAPAGGGNTNQPSTATRSLGGARQQPGQQDPKNTAAAGGSRGDSRTAGGDGAAATPNRSAFNNTSGNNAAPGGGRQSNQAPSPDPRAGGGAQPMNSSMITNKPQQGGGAGGTRPAPATAGNGSTGAASSTGGGAGGKEGREGSHGPGDGVVLSNPIHPDLDDRTSHSPAPLNEARANTPDLQTSHHGQGMASMAPQPSKSQAPSRPRGTKGASIHGEQEKNTAGPQGATRSEMF